jgi:hypothetical protein
MPAEPIVVLLKDQSIDSPMSESGLFAWSADRRHVISSAGATFELTL